jgi:enoyl-CoA hydratase/carnithine racemase
VSAPHITLEKRGELARLVIDRPDKANALSLAMMAALSEQVRACALDAATKALVITGAGARVFCAGVDVRTLTELPDADARRLRSERLFELLFALAAFAKPLVIRLNGIASGGGAMIALLGDSVIAVDHAALTFPEIDLGSPTLPALAIVSHLSGAALASDLVQSGRRMTATEAIGRGLVTEIVTPDVLDARTEQAALELGSKPAQAFALNKQWLRRALLESLHAAQDEHRRMRAAGAMP